jgi:hypothetical protein
MLLFHSQLNIRMAGPFLTRGSYRVRVVLYDGWQPVTAGPDLVVGASTMRRPLTTQEGVQVGDSWAGREG